MPSSLLGTLVMVLLWGTEGERRPFPAWGNEEGVPEDSKHRGRDTGASLAVKHTAVWTIIEM